MRRAHGVVVSRLLRMQKALGSNPSGSIDFDDVTLLQRPGFQKNQRHNLLNKIAWPSGLRRQLKALVRKGVGSNPTAVNISKRLCLLSPCTITSTTIPLCN